MKFLIFVLALALTVSAFAAPSTKKASSRLRKDTLDILSRSMSEDKIEALVRSVDGCNANVCFALSGSNRLTAGDFANQQNFALAIGDILLPNPVEYAAVQFGSALHPISNLTADRFNFPSRVAQAEFVNEGFSRAGDAVFWCSKQLRSRRGEANKIVLFTDGRDRPRRIAPFFARRFRRTGGEVCVVGVGPNRNFNRLLTIAGGDASRVFTVFSFFEFFDLLSDLVQQICGTALI